MNKFKFLCLFLSLVGITNANSLEKGKGYIKTRYEYYGQSEHDIDYKSNGNTGGRLELTGQVTTFTDQYLDFRIRKYQDFVSEDKTDEKPNMARNTETDTRFRYYFKHGKLLDTDITRTTKLEYRKYTSNTEKYAIGEVFSVNSYLPEGNEYFKINSLSFEPGIEYRVDPSNRSDYTTRVRLNVNYNFSLPFDFKLYGTLYLNQNFYEEGDRPTVSSSGDKKDQMFTAVLESYLTREWELWQKDDYKVNFEIIGGFDDMDYNNKTRFSSTTGKKTSDKWNASIYFQPMIVAYYEPSEWIQGYIGVGAEYRNWIENSGYNNEQAHNLKSWSWQPRVEVGLMRRF